MNFLLLIAIVCLNFNLHHHTIVRSHVMMRRSNNASTKLCCCHGDFRLFYIVMDTLVWIGAGRVANWIHYTMQSRRPHSHGKFKHSYIHSVSCVIFIVLCCVQPAIPCEVIYYSTQLYSILIIGKWQCQQYCGIWPLWSYNLFLHYIWLLTSQWSHIRSTISYNFTRRYISLYLLLNLNLNDCYRFSSISSSEF